jgi:hypothetical protein
MPARNAPRDRPNRPRTVSRIQRRKQGRVHIRDPRIAGCTPDKRHKQCRSHSFDV